MNFLDELRWRNLLHTVTPETENFLETGNRKAYIGFDPTAQSLTIGNYIQIMLLHFWKKAGHQAIFLMGGATGRIGDPSGKESERKLLDNSILQQNIDRQLAQARKLLGDDVIFVNNYDFYSNMNALDFLRDVGKSMTVNYMMSKDSVKTRMESGISFTEFSYQLLQSYDFFRLYSDYDCKVQMGGSDQWGNITSGIEYIRKNIIDSQAYAVTTPLLTKADGQKFGKSNDGNIWLDPKMTSPYKFYQFWINCDDADIGKFMRCFSFKSKDELESLEAENINDPKQLKKILAEELTIRIHSREDFLAVEQVSKLLFDKNSNLEFLKSLDNMSFEAIKSEIPSFEIGKVSWENDDFSAMDKICENTKIFSSKGDMRRAIQNNALSINKTKVENSDLILSNDDLLQGKYLMVENGKKNKYLIEIK